PHIISTLLPYTTLFRSRVHGSDPSWPRRRPDWNLQSEPAARIRASEKLQPVFPTARATSHRSPTLAAIEQSRRTIPNCAQPYPRSEEHTSELQSLAYLV